MIEVGRSIWMPASIPFTSALNETQFGQTHDAKADVELRGAATQLTDATVKVGDTSGVANLAAEFVPIYTLFGKRDSARPVFYYPAPVRLDFGNRMEIEAVNVGTEAAGHGVFLGVPRGEVDARVDEGAAGGYPVTLAVDMGFKEAVNEILTTTTADLDRDTLIYGAFTNAASAQLRASGVRGEQWTTDYTPVWALAGRAASQLPVLHWPRPYLIPRGSTISFDFKNVGAESAGTKIWLVGRKLGQ